MTIIGSTNSIASSPRAMMDRKIDSAVTAGSISSVDETALETALDAIDASLASSSSSSGSESARLDPSGMKDRIDSLIADQVKSGTLTDDQAATLKSLFAQNAPPVAGGETDMSATGIDGAGCVDGMRGPPPPPPSSDSGADSDSTTSESAADTLDALIAFLDNLRSSMASTTYGSATNDSSNSGLVVDSLA